MKINTNGELGNIARYMPDLSFGVAPAPRPRGFEGKPVTWSGGFSWAIPVGARHPEIAWEFIRWMVSDEATLLSNRVRSRYNRARGRLFIPDMSANRRINDRVFDEFIEKNPYLDANFKTAYRVCADLMPFSRFRPVTPVGQLLWDEHVRAFERATHHQFSAAEALDIGTREVQKELDRLSRDTSSYPRMRWHRAFGWAFVVLLVAAAVAFLRTHRARVGGWRRNAVRESVAGFLFASPWILGFLVFTAGPIVASILLSFTEYDVLHPARYVGGANYVELVTRDPVFWKALGNTAFMALGVPVGMAVSLGIALLLNANVKGMAVYRTIFYLPAIVPVVASSVLWIWVFNPDGGLLNTGLRFLGLEGVLSAFAKGIGAAGLYWLQEERLAKPALILMTLWGAGSSMIIWLAGLKGIPKHLYEAAEMDGAGRWSRFVHITLPMLSPYIFFNLIMGVIGTFQIFTQAYIMTQGGPADATLFYVYYLFNSGFQYFRMGYASAMAWILFAIILALTLIQFRLAPRWVHYDAGDSG
jgi:multiple sugar transport system permease protein